MPSACTIGCGFEMVFGLTSARTWRTRFEGGADVLLTDASLRLVPTVAGPDGRFSSQLHTEDVYDGVCIDEQSIADLLEWYPATAKVQC